LVATQEIPAIKNARLFLDLVDGLKISRRRILFIMNRYDRAIKITPEQVGETFKQEVLGVIPFDERVNESVRRGIPFMPADRTPLGKSYLALVDGIKQRLTEFQETAAGGTGPIKKK
jgi:Flp pilus assembly CpaE family ATPase